MTNEGVTEKFVKKMAVKKFLQSKKNLNKNLIKAKINKKDEFYTQLSDIEKELHHYKNHFKGKTIFCNCDDPEESNFWNYFALNFEFLGLKRLISTHFEIDKPSYKLEIISDINNDGRINKLDTIKTVLKQNGDFRSPECIEILKEADIIVTNPPFSLFREYIAQLIEYDKSFIIIGHQNAITYKEIFKLIKNEKLWLGVNNNQSFVFKSPYKNNLEANLKFCKQKGYLEKNYIKVPAINWYTNLDFKKRHEDIILYKIYYKHEDDYPTYDNYDAINVDKVKDIPMDYKGIIGVPITLLGKHNPEQFEIVKFRKGNDDKDLTIGGKCPYFRILIKNKKIQRN